MVTTYVAAQHAVVARHLPGGVTGSSPLTTVQKHVSLKIDRYSDQTVPQNAANPTEVYGIVYVVAGAALVTIATYGRLMWWRGSERRCPPVSPEPEGGAAALPPA